MVKIRKATLEDETQVFDLLRQLMTSASADHPVNQKNGYDTFRRMLDDDDAGTVFVAEEDGVMLGLVTLSYPLAIRCGGSYSSIEEFIVTEQARGKGVGGALLEAVVTKATEKGCYELLVSRPSDLGLPVYIRHGWKDDGKALLMNLPRETA
ncbi:MAG TPA: GNAT family N-acetyltransferase [Dehalococcoidia bacterium]|nr:GNAT family N-acetyltransferase [Dehalococcoidia bacterium]